MEAQIQSIATTQYNDIMPEVQEIITNHMDIGIFFSYAMCSKETLRQTKACILQNKRIVSLCKKLSISPEKLFGLTGVQKLTVKLNDKHLIDSKLTTILLMTFPHLSILNFHREGIGMTLLIENSIIQKATLIPQNRNNYTNTVLKILGYCPQVPALSTCKVFNNIFLEEPGIIRTYGDTNWSVHVEILQRFKSASSKTVYNALKSEEVINSIRLITQQDARKEVGERRVYHALRKYYHAKKIEELKFMDLKIIDLSNTASQTYIRKLDDALLFDSIYYRLIKKSPNIESLNLNFCKDDIDEHVEIFSAFLDNFPVCPTLKNLHLQNTLVTNKQLKRIGEMCPNLEFLDITKCYNISKLGLKEFVRIRKKFYPEKIPVLIRETIPDRKNSAKVNQN